MILLAGSAFAATSIDKEARALVVVLVSGAS
jgi:hypothetical protein